MKRIIQFIQSSGIPDRVFLAFIILMIMALSRTSTWEFLYCIRHLSEGLLSWLISRNDAASAQLAFIAEYFVGNLLGYICGLVLMYFISDHALRMTRLHSELTSRFHEQLECSAEEEQRAISTKLTQIQKSLQEFAYALNNRENLVDTNFNKVAEHIASFGSALKKLETRSDETYARQQRAKKARKETLSPKRND